MGLGRARPAILSDATSGRKQQLSSNSRFERPLPAKTSDARSRAPRCPAHRAPRASRLIVRSNAPQALATCRGQASRRACHRPTVRMGRTPIRDRFPAYPPQYSAYLPNRPGAYAAERLTGVSGSLFQVDFHHVTFGPNEPKWPPPPPNLTGTTPNIFRTRPDLN